MARIGESITAIGTTLPATSFAFSLASGANSARDHVLGLLWEMKEDRLLDFLTRHSPSSPFANRAGENLFLQLSGILPQDTQVIATYLGLALNTLSAIGYVRSNRESLTSNVPILGISRPIIEILSTLSLAIAPNIVISMIEQLKFLQTATNLGATETAAILVPGLLILPALLKVPSLVEGAGYVINDAIVRPIAGAVRGAINTNRRKERSAILNTIQAEEAEAKNKQLAIARSLNGFNNNSRMQELYRPRILRLRPTGIPPDKKEKPVDLIKQLQLPQPIGLDLPPFMKGTAPCPPPPKQNFRRLPKFLYRR